MRKINLNRTLTPYFDLYCFNFNKNKYKLMDVRDMVQLFKNSGINYFIGMIRTRENNQTGYIVFYKKENSYEPFGIAVNKFLKK
jgi:hypothetical protein